MVYQKLDIFWLFLCKSIAVFYSDIIFYYSITKITIVIILLIQQNFFLG